MANAVVFGSSELAPSRGPQDEQSIATSSAKRKGLGCSVSISFPLHAAMSTNVDAKRYIELSFCYLRICNRMLTEFPSNVNLNYCKTSKYAGIEA